MSNKWFENIPKSGVLCKATGYETQFVHIRDKQDFLEFLCDYACDETDLEPITTAEFWQFAPWQDMKDAPQSQEIIVEFVVDSEKFYEQVSKEDTEFYNRFGQEVIANPIKWLPLPEMNHD